MHMPLLILHLTSKLIENAKLTASLFIADYDVWLVENALDHGFLVIDASQTILAVHQTGADGNYAGHAHIIHHPPTNKDMIDWSRFHICVGHSVCGQLETRYDKGRVSVHTRRLNICYVWKYGIFALIMVAIRHFGVLVCFLQERSYRDEVLHRLLMDTCR